MGVNYLADKSAFVRGARPEVFDEWSDLVLAGRIWLCPPTRSEILYSARSWAEYEREEADLEAAFPDAFLPDDAWRRVAVTQRELARIGHHRGPGIPDLLVAVCAAFHGLTVLHYDADFDAIAKVTGQTTRWLAEPGTMP